MLELTVAVAKVYNLTHHIDLLIAPVIAITHVLSTHADGSRVSKAIVHVCDSVSVSVRMIKPKRLKLKSPKVKGQGHRVTKCKKAIEWPA